MIIVMVRIPVGTEEEGERLAERFRNRPGMVDSRPGFLGFELLKGEGEYVSMTRWASREDLQAWMQSEAHAQTHAHVPGAMGGARPHSAHPGATSHSGQTGPAASSTMVYEVIIPVRRMD
jgi:heme-degrading monooxygenase HmoA